MPAKTEPKTAKSKWNGYSLKPRKEMPDGLWMRCGKCERMLYKSTVRDNLNVCPECNHHFRCDSNVRINTLVDEGSFQEMLPDLRSSDPLSFAFRGTTYKKRADSDVKASGQPEALRAGRAFVKGRGVALTVMEPNFLMGSMGAVVGEKFCAAVDLAVEASLPLVAVCASGGARMHEGVVSLGQMAKTAAALARFSDLGGLFITVLTDPTAGGIIESQAPRLKAWIERMLEPKADGDFESWESLDATLSPQIGAWAIVGRFSRSGSSASRRAPART